MKTQTLSILALRLATHGVSRIESASVVSLHIAVLSLGLAAIMRRFGLNLGVRHINGSIGAAKAWCSGLVKAKWDHLTGLAGGRSRGLTA